MKASDLAFRILRDMGDETVPPAVFYRPDTGLAEVAGFAVLLPQTEMRVDHVPALPLIEAWIAFAFLPRTATGGGGHREHANGGGYALNVRPEMRIGVRKVGADHWYLDASTWIPPVGASMELLSQWNGADTLASQRRLSGLYDISRGVYVRASEYGDYRMYAEPTRETRFTGLDGKPLPKHGDPLTPFVRSV